jgi:excisionase family DNA binding protein
VRNHPSEVAAATTIAAILPGDRRVTADEPSLGSPPDGSIDVGKKVEAGTMTAEEVAQLLGLSQGAVYAGAKKGEIPCRRVGRRFVFWRATVLAWLREQDRGSRSENR